MKKSIIVTLFSLQILTLVVVTTTAYFTFMNKARIRATQRVMVDTQERLGSTFAFMDKVTEAQQQQQEAQKPLTEGVEAPSFELQDENQETVSLKDYRGKKTLLVFSDDDCPHCKSFYPILNEFQAQKSDINVVIMQMESTPEQNKKFKNDYQIKAPLLATTMNEVIAYKIKMTPTSVLLDERGRVLGTKNIDKLEQLINFVDNPTASISPHQEPNKG